MGGVICMSNGIKIRCCGMTTSSVGLNKSYPATPSVAWTGNFAFLDSRSTWRVACCSLMSISYGLWLRLDCWLHPKSWRAFAADGEHSQGSSFISASSKMQCIAILMHLVWSSITYTFLSVAVNSKKQLVCIFSLARCFPGFLVMMGHPKFCNRFADGLCPVYAWCHVNGTVWKQVSKV